MLLIAMTSNDYSGQNLYKKDFTGKDLSKANFKRANLKGAIFIGANLEGADLTGAVLTNANLTGANLTDARLVDADCGWTYFAKANLTRTDLTGAKMEFANLSEATLTQTNLSKSFLQQANLAGANLSHARLWDTCLNNACLDGATVGWTTLVAIDLKGASLVDVNFQSNCQERFTGCQFDMQTVFKNTSYHGFSITGWPVQINGLPYDVIFFPSTDSVIVQIGCQVKPFATWQQEVSYWEEIGWPTNNVHLRNTEMYELREIALDAAKAFERQFLKGFYRHK